MTTPAEWRAAVMAPWVEEKPDADMEPPLRSSQETGTDNAISDRLVRAEDSSRPSTRRHA